MAGLLTSAQLTAFRAVASSALDISGVVIQRNAASNDGYGLMEDDWSTIATVDASEAKPTGAIMTQYAAKIGTLKSWVMRFPWNTDCQEADQILMPSGEVRLVQVNLSDSSYSTANLYLVSTIKP